MAPFTNVADVVNQARARPPPPKRTPVPGTCRSRPTTLDPSARHVGLLHQPPTSPPKPPRPLPTWSNQSKTATTHLGPGPRRHPTKSLRSGPTYEFRGIFSSSHSNRWRINRHRPSPWLDLPVVVVSSSFYLSNRAARDWRQSSSRPALIQKAASFPDVMKTVALAASITAAVPGKRAMWDYPGRRLPHAVAAGVKGTERARRRGAVRAALAERGLVSGAAALEEAGTGGGGCSGYPPVSPDALHEWMTFSVKEIVKDVGETPLLVHVYDHRQGEGQPRLEKEKTKAGIWPRVVKRWKDGCPVPDGMILVEQLDANNSNVSLPPSEAGSIESNVGQPASKEGSKMWGVLVQGRGLQCAACYILKTDTVKSTMGYCTYFCLARASCFGEAAVLQLRNSWLVDSPLSRFQWEEQRWP